MDEERFDKLHFNTISEPISKKTYFCLKEDHIEEGHAQWGWSENIEYIRDNFLYIFVLGYMFVYNEKHKVNRVSTDVLMNLMDGEQIDMSKLTEEELKFFTLWKSITNCKDFKGLKKKTKVLCEYMFSLGYELNFGIYKNAKEAVNIALFLDRFIPEGEEGFGSYLKTFIDENY